MLNEGNIDLANQYLGYEYIISGKVIEGKNLVELLGFQQLIFLLKKITN
jgi:riboflavin kinase/FMN adenylyltransferase